MRPIMARLRSARPGPAVVREPDTMPAPDPDFEDPGIPEKRQPERRITMSYGDAEGEAHRVCQRLGLDVPDFLDVGDLVRFAYAQGWLGCEARLASPNMADLIYQAIKDPASVIAAGAGDIQHQVRAVQQVVTYGVKSEPH